MSNYFKSKYPVRDTSMVPDMPTGRVVITGKVISIKDQYVTFGGRSKVVWKMLVESDLGWRVWGTVPASILDDLQRGDRVEFTATVEVSDRDRVFGFAGRPANARILAGGPVGGPHPTTPYAVKSTPPVARVTDPVPVVEDEADVDYLRESMNRLAAFKN